MSIDDPVKSAEAELIRAVFDERAKIHSVRVLKAAAKLAKTLATETKRRKGE